MTALEIQADYRAQLQAAGLGDPTVLQMWGECLDHLAAEPSSCTELDWVAKLNLIQSFRRRDDLDWDHPRLAQLDLAYAELSDRSPYAALVRAGRMPELVDQADVERAMVEPPSDTRAYVRGRLAADCTARVAAVDWSWVLLADGRGRLDLPDPYAGTSSDVADAGGLDRWVRLQSIR